MDAPVGSSDRSTAAAVAARAEAMRKLKRTALVLAALGVLALAWNALTAHHAAAELRASAAAQAIVTVATARPRPLAESTELVLPGNLQANYEAPIYARTSGYLKRWLTDIGTQVKAGQLLAEIEAPEIDQQLRQAEADVANAEANQKIALLTAERWRNLRATDSVSKQEADEKISQATSSEAQLRAAKANVQRLRELAGFERIVAPFAGVITARATDVGQLISAGSGSGRELFRIADVHRLRLYVQVPQTYAASMQPGVTADLSFPDRPGTVYHARLDRTASAIDAASRTLLTELLIDNASGELLPGSYAEVHFKLLPNAQRHSFLLPANVLLFRGDGLRVAAVGADGRVRLKPVTIGRDYGAEVEIQTGIAAEDQVVLSPPDSLTDGAEVRVSNTATAGARHS